MPVAWLHLSSCNLGLALQNSTGFLMCTHLRDLLCIAVHCSAVHLALCQALNLNLQPCTTWRCQRWQMHNTQHKLCLFGCSLRKEWSIKRYLQLHQLPPGTRVMGVQACMLHLTGKPDEWAGHPDSCACSCCSMAISSLLHSANSEQAS